MRVWIGIWGYEYFELSCKVNLIRNREYKKDWHHFSRFWFHSGRSWFFWTAETEKVYCCLFKLVSKVIPVQGSRQILIQQENPQTPENSSRNKKKTRLWSACAFSWKCTKLIDFSAEENGSLKKKSAFS